MSESGNFRLKKNETNQKCTMNYEAIKNLTPPNVVENVTANVV